MSEEQDADDIGQTLLSHLLELRNRLLRAGIAVVIAFVPLAMVSGELFHWLSGPLLAYMPEGTSLIATQVAAPFLVPFKLAMLTAVVVSLPWILYQIWAFVAPGLYMHERRLAVPLLASSTLLFYAGMAFAYYVVFPLIFRFFVGIAPEGVAVMTDISNYLDFVLGLFFVFGVTFEIPVAMVLMVWAGFITPAQCKQMRPYVLVGVFAIAMILTPPDVISQTLLAIPMYLLFEAGILCSRWLVPGAREVEAQRERDAGSGRREA